MYYDQSYNKIESKYEIKCKSEIFKSCRWRWADIITVKVKYKIKSASEIFYSCMWHRVYYDQSYNTSESKYKIKYKSEIFNSCRWRWADIITVKVKYKTNIKVKVKYLIVAGGAECIMIKVIIKVKVNMK